MILDYVMPMNLERRKDKWYFILGCLRKIGFQPTQIIQFISHDAQDYQDITSICEAMRANGFDYDASDPIISSTDIRILARIWTIQSALQKIVELDKTVLLLIDDFSPVAHWTYNRLNHLVQECYRCEYDHGPFRLLQLSHSYDPCDRNIHEPHTSMLSKGLSGFNGWGGVFSPAGAKVFLEVYAFHPTATPETLFLILAELKNKHDYSYGMWHTIDPILENLYEFGSDLVDATDEPERWIKL